MKRFSTLLAFIGFIFVVKALVEKKNFIIINGAVYFNKPEKKEVKELVDTLKEKVGKVDGEK